MKSFIKYLIIITTTIILVIGVPLYSFALTYNNYSPAMGAVLTYQTSDTSGNISAATAYPTLYTKSQIEDLPSWYLFCDGLLADSKYIPQFDYYYVSSAVVAYSPSDPSVSYGNLYFDYDVSASSGFNYIEFDVGVYGSQSFSNDYFSITAYSDGVIVDIPLTITYSSTDKYYEATFDGIYQRWRTVKLSAFYDSLYTYDISTIRFSVKTYLPPRQNREMVYGFGVSDLVTRTMSEQDYISSIAENVVNISSKIDYTNTQLGIIGSDVTDIKEQVSDVVDILKQDLSPEQQERVDDFNDKILDYRDSDDAVINDFNSTVDDYLDLNYDIFDNPYKDDIDSDVNSVLNSSFLDFFDPFWNNPTIILYVSVAILFAVSGFVFYGVR